MKIICPLFYLYTDGNTRSSLIITTLKPMILCKLQTSDPNSVLSIKHFATIFCDSPSGPANIPLKAFVLGVMHAKFVQQFNASDNCSFMICCCWVYR